MPDLTYGPAVYRKQSGGAQGATEMVVASGGRITIEPGGLIDASTGRFLPPVGQSVGVIPLNIMNARVLSSGEAFVGINLSATGTDLGTSVGGFLSGGSTPKLIFNSTADRAMSVMWASAQVQAITFGPVPIPNDIDTATNAQVNLWSEKTSGAGNSVGWTVELWSGVGDTNFGSTTPAITSAPTNKQVSFSASNIAVSDGFLNVKVAPQAHGNDSVQLYHATITYKRAAS